MDSSTFADLGVSESVRAVLSARGIETPFPVQELVLPVADSGRDVLVKSPTGSGKTLAFGLPLVEGTEPGGRRPIALVLAPTRELANQIETELAPLAAARKLRVAVCYGGVSMANQARDAQRADIIVATPGRLLDLTRRGRLSLADIEVLVLDEADRMLDMGFLPQVDAIVELLPTDRQTMFFSATLDGDVGKLAQRFTRDPAILSVVDGPGSEEPLSERLDQSFAACASTSDRTRQLLDLINDEAGLVLVFCRTRRGAGRLAERLTEKGVSADEMHGDLSQNQRERALRNFGKGRTRVLVATDVAARGIDLDDIGLVVNFDPPEDQAAYTHRVGRTARAGRSGRAVTLVMPEHAEQVGRIAASLGLHEGWTSTGYAMAPPRVLYGSRKRGSVFAPGRKPRPRPGGSGAPTDNAAPRRNRVPRGSRPTA
jgi:ATP-dependent RNA helicase RhlE